MVRSANDITDAVLGGLHPIQEDVGRIKDAYGSTRSEDFNQALTDADSSGAGRSGPGRRSMVSPSCALVTLSSSLIKYDLDIKT